MADKNSLVYDQVNRKWVKDTSKTSSGSSAKDATKKESTTGAPKTTGGSSSAKKTVSNTKSSTKVNSKKIAEKKYIDVEYNTLQASLKLIPTKDTVKLRQNQTINIAGIGSYLSGKYFIAGVHRSVDSDGGFDLSIDVIKTGFGDSLKKKTVSPKNTTTRKTTVQKTAGVQFKIKDKVKIVGTTATYANAHAGVKVPNWVKNLTLTIDKVDSVNAKVRVQPINSWTYTKFIKKV